jgi:transcriptional regulator with XRE-family HTH domain
MTERRERTGTTFEVALASTIRAERERLGLTQDEVAKQAVTHGFDWTAASVAAIETKRRHVTIPEFLSLPFILGGDLTVPGLLERLGRVEYAAGASVDGKFFALLAEGRNDKIRDADVREFGMTTPLDRRAARLVAEATAEFKNATAILRRRGWKMTHGAREDALLASRGEAERKMGYTLKVPAVEVALAAQHLWGRSLTEHRDRLVDDAETGRESRRALRGHVTRQLRQQLAAELGKVG